VSSTCTAFFALFVCRVFAVRSSFGRRLCAFDATRGGDDGTKAKRRRRKRKNAPFFREKRRLFFAYRGRDGGRQGLRARGQHARLVHERGHGPPLAGG
jgi:hypothetical protein